MDNAKIIAVDFDGTLVENKWPEIGAPIEKNIAKVKAEQEAGAKIILWTNRVGEPLEKALLAAIISSTNGTHSATGLKAYRRLC